MSRRQGVKNRLEEIGQGKDSRLPAPLKGLRPAPWPITYDGSGQSRPKNGHFPFGKALFGAPPSAPSTLPCPISSNRFFTRRQVL